MTTIRKLCVALFVSTLALTATAQERRAGSPASPTADASTPHDCVKPMLRHDHTAEKGGEEEKPAKCWQKTHAVSEQAFARLVPRLTKFSISYPTRIKLSHAIHWPHAEVGK